MPLRIACYSTIALLVSLLIAERPLRAQPAEVPPPPAVSHAETTDIPKGSKHAAHVYSAILAPGQVTTWHTHTAPVFVYVVEGTFLLEMQGKASLEARTGQAIMEPVRTVMRGKNPSATAPAHVVMFQVNAPGKPFLNPTKP